MAHLCDLLKMAQELDLFAFNNIHVEENIQKYAERRKKLDFYFDCAQKLPQEEKSLAKTLHDASMELMNIIGLFATFQTTEKSTTSTNQPQMNPAATEKHVKNEEEEETAQTLKREKEPAAPAAETKLLVLQEVLTHIGTMPIEETNRYIGNKAALNCIIELRKHRQKSLLIIEKQQRDIEILRETLQNSNCLVDSLILQKHALQAQLNALQKKK